jgi:hypothetical protein
MPARSPLTDLNGYCTLKDCDSDLQPYRQMDDDSIATDDENSKVVRSGSSSRLLSVKVNVQTAHTWVFLVASSPGVGAGVAGQTGGDICQQAWGYLWASHYA